MEQLNTFRSFVGEAPALVEWMLIDSKPTVTAVVIQTPRPSSFNITRDVSAEALERFTVLARESHKASCQRADAERIASLRLDLSTGDIGTAGGAA
ncbi:MAG: hypothetical protein WAQ08_15910 [Aquabacterium sp.]|uniref:hypothetical protein n=1 Tax=Aquabacterium sp. TaxID=1872578 RepID=UPI003BAF0FE9